MLICDMCKERLPTEEECPEEAGGEKALGMDLCFDCFKKIQEFVEKNTKK